MTSNLNHLVASEQVADRIRAADRDRLARAARGEERRTRPSRFRMLIPARLSRGRRQRAGIGGRIEPEVAGMP
jgi:hypothetical protein